MYRTVSLSLLCALLPALCHCGMVKRANERNCGRQAAEHPHNIRISGGKITGVTHGIVGGSEVTPNSWPWQVYLTSRAGACGATVLNKNWVLTAAHCVDDGSGDAKDSAFVGRMRDSIAANMGVHNRQHRAPKSCGASQLIIHQDWPGMANIRAGKGSIVNDLALVKLDCTLEWTDKVIPACLPTESDSFFTKGEKVVITGWGREYHAGTGAVRLKQLVTDIVGKNAWSPSVVMSAGDAQGACMGDSGGPMHAYRGGKWVLAGVASYITGGKCESAKGQSGYVHVPTFLSWINHYIRY